MTARTVAQRPAEPRTPARQGVDTDALLTAAQWHCSLFREPPPRQYVDTDRDDYDDDGRAA